MRSKDKAVSGANQTSRERNEHLIEGKEKNRKNKITKPLSQRYHRIPQDEFLTHLYFGLVNRLNINTLILYHKEKQHRVCSVIFP